MKKALKWIGIVVAVLLVLSGVIALKVYSDIKSTVEEIYTPIHEEMTQVSQGETPKEAVQKVDVSSKEPFSVLLLGVDERQGDKGRSDTMIVLTVNPNEGTTKMLSIPRDTYTEIIGTNDNDKINHAFAFGGMPMSIATVENFLDIPINYVAKVNMEGFIDIVDIVNGVSVDNALEFDYDGEHFPMGELSLDGESALKYVRMRYDDPSGDFGRQNRQKQVIQGVLKKSLSLNTVMNYQSIFKTLEENVEINVNFDELLKIRKNYGNSFKEIEQLYITNGSDTMMNGIYYYIPNEQELNSVKETLKKHLEIKT